MDVEHTNFCTLCFALVQMVERKGNGVKNKVPPGGRLLFVSHQISDSRGFVSNQGPNDIFLGCA